MAGRVPGRQETTNRFAAVPQSLLGRLFGVLPLSRPQDRATDIDAADSPDATARDRRRKGRSLGVVGLVHVSSLGPGPESARDALVFGAARPTKEDMSKKLYVGNLSFQTSEDDLRQLFGQYGTVASAQVVMDRETGRSRGFAFVEMSDGADEAIQALNMAEYQGRNLTVNEAKPREDRPRGGGGYGGGGGRGYGGGGGGGGYGGGGGGGGGRGGYGGGGKRY